MAEHDRLEESERKKIPSRLKHIQSSGSGTDGGRLLFCVGTYTLSQLLWTWVFGSAFVAFLLTLGTIAVSFRAFLVDVAGATGSVYLNRLNGMYRTFLRGWGIKYPWEQLFQHVNLELESKMTFSGTFPSRDGPEMEAEWEVVVGPNPDALARYLHVSRTTVEQAIGAISSSILRRKFRSSDSDDLAAATEGLERACHDSLREAREDYLGPGDMPISIEDLMGTTVLVFSLTDVDYEQAVQDARILKTRAKSIKKATKKLGGGESALNIAAGLDNPNAERKVFAIEGADDIGNAVAAGLAALFGKGGSQ